MMPAGACPADIMIVGEAPSPHERVPFTDYSGQAFDKMLHEAGILRSECFLTNVVREPVTLWNRHIDRRKKHPGAGQWTQFNGVWCSPSVIAGMEQLHREVERCKPKVIVALGNLSLWALTGNWGTMDWRGSTLPYTRSTEIYVVPTYHPAAVLKQWSLRPYVTCDLKRVRSHSVNGVVWDNYNFIIAPHFNEACNTLRALIADLDQGPLHLSCDIETRAGHIACIGIAWSNVAAMCIPLMTTDRSRNYSYWTEDEEFIVLWLVRAVLTHHNARISGQNYVYDTQYKWRHLKFIPNFAFDTLLAHHVCWPGTDKDLATLSSLYCRIHKYWKDDSKNWDPKLGEKQLWTYNCEDAVRTWEIAECLVNLVEKLGLVEPCLFQHRMWWRVLETMIRGVRMDLGNKSELGKKLASEIKQREEWMTSILGHPINLRSPHQLKALFYDDLKLPLQLDRKTKKPSTNEVAMTALCRKEPLIKPIVRVISEVRSLGVFRSTFVEGELDQDMRMRCSYNVGGTETFRFSSSENAFGSGMNLQNVPSGGTTDEEDPHALVLPNVRELFLPDPGYELFDMDLASADLCIVAWDANEDALKAMLAAKISVYLQLAKEYYQDDRVTKADGRYTKFKSLCHGTNYLGTARGLAVRLGLSVAQIERIQQWYFGKFPNLKRWQENLKAQVDSKRSVQNIFGYRRYYFDRIDQSIYNQAAAWKPQSTIGLLINKIWDRILNHESEVQILLQVHDSLVGQYPKDRAAYFRPRLKELSLIPLPYSDPLVIDTGFKFSDVSWGHCK
jgi:DNA polymerase I-like protein with 3'-5' exonuclease and polymerase domains/uracil-DNA glycosylase